jgi:hypothetical protein
MLEHPHTKLTTHLGAIAERLEHCPLVFTIARKKNSLESRQESGDEKVADSDIETVPFFSLSSV